MESSSVFIDSLHEGTSLGSLWRLFKPFGRIVEVHRPTKRRIPTNTRYAFVGYESVEQAKAAILSTDGQLLDGVQIRTQFARPRRKLWNWQPGDRQYPRRSGLQPQPPQQQFQASQFFSETPPTVHEEVIKDSPLGEDATQGSPVQLTPSEAIIPLLDSSVSVTTLTWKTIEQVREVFANNIGVLHIIGVSACEYIIVFKNRDDRQFFMEKGKWSKAEWKVEIWQEARPRSTRIVNVVIRGIPPQAWTRKSIQAIIQGFGEIVDVETDFNLVPNKFEVAVTIRTHIRKIINEEIDVIFDNMRSTVGVIEVWSEESGEITAPIQKENGRPVDLTPSEQERSRSVINLHGASEERSTFEVGKLQSRGASVEEIISGALHVFVGKLFSGSAGFLGNGKLLSGAFNNKLAKGVERCLSATVPRNIQLFISPYSSCGMHHVFSSQDIPRVGLASNTQLVAHIDYDCCSSPVFSSCTDGSSLEHTQSPLFSTGPPCVSGEISPSRAEGSFVVDVGLTSSPNQGHPSPVNGKTLPTINLQVDISPVNNIKKNIKCSKVRRKKQKKSYPSISSEARECLKYGQRLRIHIPYPKRSLANIDRILRNSRSRM